MDFLNTAEKRDRRMVHLPMGRFGEAVEVAKGALFRTSLPASFPIPPRSPFAVLTVALLTVLFALRFPTVASDDSSYMTVSV